MSTKVGPGAPLRWRLLPARLAGRDFFSLPAYCGEVMRMYITLEQMTGILTVLIALVGLVYKIAHKK